jgi:Tol biopolymer transport system component
VFVCDANGKNRKQLTKLGGQNSLAAFSPDGKKIAFQHVPQGQGAGSLYIMNADGSNPKEILRGEGSIDASRPVWDLR